MKNYMTITDSKYKVNIKILRQWIEGRKIITKKPFAFWYLRFELLILFVIGKWYKGLKKKYVRHLKICLSIVGRGRVSASYDYCGSKQYRNCDFSSICWFYDPRNCWHWYRWSSDGVLQDPCWGQGNTTDSLELQLCDSRVASSLVRRLKVLGVNSF